MSIFSRINVMSGWHWDLRHCWWRYVVMPIGKWERVDAMGWSSISIFGVAFFWMHKLSPEQERRAILNGRKVKEWAKKNGQEIK